MKLQSIRLHPYAGIADKKYSFENGLTVICGPNEEGKSTVAKAIRQVLFLETSLTPARKQNELQHVLPVTGGDTIRITLRFLFNNISFTLTKQWGPISNTELSESNGRVLTDNKAVQERIFEMVPANQAVVEQVLIASQSQLADAVDKLTNTVQASLSDQLRGAVLKGGGISATQLEETIVKKVESYFARWDESSSTVHGGASRGLTNQWNKGVGRIAACWYKWQEAIEIGKEIENYESENSRLQEKLNKCNEELNIVTAYLKEHKAAYDAVNQRIKIEGESAKIQADLQGSAKDGRRWPDALAEQIAAKTSFESVKGELQEIENELNQARHKAEAQKDLEKLERVNALKKIVGEAEVSVRDTIQISEADLIASEKYQYEISRAQALIDGQKLRLQINPTTAGEIQLVHSGGKIETMHFSSGEQMSKDINGSVAFNWRGVSFSIQSINEDIATLELSVRKASTDLEAILKKYNQSSVENLKVAANQYRGVDVQLKQAKSNLQIALGNDTFEGLQTRCQEAVALPGTRDINKLDELKGKKAEAVGQQKNILDSLGLEIEAFEEKYGSRENLDEQRLTSMQAFREKQKELGLLPPLPAAYDSALGFQKEYTDKLEKERDETNARHEIELEMQALKEPSFSISEAKEQVELTNRKFLNTLAEGKAYRRIHVVLQNILASADNNAFKPLHQKTESYLERLSAGRFKHIPFEVTQPQRLEGDGVALPVWLLSKGTKDILALSLRLAAAEVYLENNSGFVIMDDPLVDMDSRRRKASAALLNEFSKKFQTIVFTCHEEHENLLKAAKVEKADATV